MTLRHMRIFLAVCQSDCNTTKAAEALNMSQPAVSLAIKDLEECYNVVLFDRIGRRLSLTQAGRTLADYALHIVGLFDDMAKGMKSWDELGSLHIGSSLTIGTRFMPYYVKAFSSMHPQIDVRVTIAPSEKLERMILDNQLDFALIEGIAHSPSISCEPYMEDSLVVIAPAEGPYEMSLETFKSQRLLLREKGSGTREVFDKVIELAGFAVEPRWEAMSTAALVNAVIMGLGISVLPRHLLEGALADDLVHEVKVQGLQFNRKFNIIWHREKYLTASATAFMDLCKTSSLDSMGVHDTLYFEGYDGHDSPGSQSSRT